MDTSCDYELWYGNVQIGHIADVCFRHMTWFGTLERGVYPSNEELVHRLASFIELCKVCNERTLSSPIGSPDSSDYDQYSDLLKSGLWVIKNTAGEAIPISTPEFFVGGKLSWLPKEQRAG